MCFLESNSVLQFSKALSHFICIVFMFVPLNLGEFILSLGNHVIPGCRVFGSTGAKRE